MKVIQENLTLFIAEQKIYFETILAPNENNLKWNESWKYSKSNVGFLIDSNTCSINFNKINISRFKGMFRDDESYQGKYIKIDPLYAHFIQAFLVYKIRKTSNIPSSTKINAISLLLKRIYIRLLMSGIVTSPCNISSESLSATSELLATFRKKNTLADDQTYLNGIAIILRKKQITYGEPEFEITTRRTQRASTKKVKEAEFAEGLGDEESEKLIEIQDFLNLIALRGILKKDSEIIMFNMLLLLFVTGFRYEELAGVTANALKKLEIEDKSIRDLLKKRGLRTYYLGIFYQGKKGAGMRTNWVEPLAIDLVEFIFEDTLTRTKKLRNQVVIHRQNKFKTLLPQELISKNSNVAILQEPEIELADVVAYIYESTADGIRHFGDLKKSAKDKLAKDGFLPYRIVKINERDKFQYYTLTQIDEFLKQAIKSSRDLADDMIYRVRDSKNGYAYDVKYENLLFITEFGSTALTRTGMVKPLATPISIRSFSAYLGMTSATSIFSRYNLKTQTGEFTQLKTHMPRHNKNTFLAIADVAEHLQAMIMGRADITQNQKYQHLAIEEKSLTTDLISGRQSNAGTGISLSLTAVDKLKDTGIIGINPDLKLENALAQNTHTFTTDRDRVSFITDVLDDIDLDIFEEFSDELAVFKDANEKKDIIRTHSDLNPLVFGSCMRKVSVIECPFNMMCQDGTPCPYHTLTGRADESDKVAFLTISIESEISRIKQLKLTKIIDLGDAEELLDVLNSRKINIQMLSKQSQSFETKKVPVNLLEYDAKRKCSRLASLFAIEHRATQKKS